MTFTSAMTHNLKLLNANIDNEKIDSHLISTRSYYKYPRKDFKTVLLLWYTLSSGFN